MSMSQRDNVTEHRVNFAVSDGKYCVKSQIDPEEERKILARKNKASAEYFSNTIQRHTLVLKKRDLMRRKAEEEKKKTISRLLAAEGLEEEI